VLLADRQLRDAFCRQVHQRTPGAISAYWNQVIFSGRDVPPPERQSVPELLEYVRRTPGAIGYIPADAPAPGVRVIVVR